MYSQLRSGAGKKLVLEAGYGPESGEEDDITVCKVGGHRARPTDNRWAAVVVVVVVVAVSLVPPIFSSGG